MKSPFPNNLPHPQPLFGNGIFHLLKEIFENKNCEHFFLIININTIFLFISYKNTIRINWLVYCHIQDTYLVGFYPSDEMQSMYSSAPVDWAYNA